MPGAWYVLGCPRSSWGPTGHVRPGTWQYTGCLECPKSSLDPIGHVRPGTWQYVQVPGCPGMSQVILGPHKTCQTYDLEVRQVPGMSQFIPGPHRTCENCDLRGAWIVKGCLRSSLNPTAIGHVRPGTWAVSQVHGMFLDISGYPGIQYMEGY